MHRRQFCLSALSAGVAAALPGCSKAPSGAGAASTIDAISGNGEELSLERAAVGELADSLSGRVYLANDEGYDAARMVWNGMHDKRPAIVVQCLSAQDVSNAVTFARERSLLLAVKGGGHSLPGKSTCDGGMVIDLSQMQAVDVDPAAATARADGGALLGHLDGATFPHGLATTTGIVSHTGIGGFTLGGGLGRTDRKFGIACDNVLGATLVTADGEVRRVSADENPDLFWAIRGGGGNFGVATEIVYRLHDFDPTVYGGTLVWSFDQARDLLRFWAEFNETLPNEANVEPIWYVNEDGEREIITEIIWSGDHAAGEKVLAPLAGFGKRKGGELGPLSYVEFQTQIDGYMAHGTRNYLKSGFMVELTEASIDAMVGNFEGDNLPSAWFQHQGGAMAELGATDTAFVHRDAIVNLGINTLWHDPDEDESHIEAVRNYHAAMEPYMKGFYTNLHDDSEKKTWGNYGENYPRLVDIKERYDPTNLFRLNANIQPTA